MRDLELKAGDNELKFKSVVRVGGSVTYALKLDQIADDKFAENNRYAATLDVPGRPTVLYVEGQPQRASYLTSALTAQQFDVDVRAPAAFPGSIKELERYDFVVSPTCRRSRSASQSQELVEKYVRDLGGGFLFAGGEAGLRPRRLGPHHHRADLAGAHGRRAPQRHAERGDGAGHRSLRLDDRAADGDGQGRVQGHREYARGRRSDRGRSPSTRRRRAT